MELARVNEEAILSKVALDRVNEGLLAGELEQNQDGSLVGSKRRSSVANVISNFEDL